MTMELANNPILDRIGLEDSFLKHWGPTTGQCGHYLDSSLTQSKAVSAFKLIVHSVVPCQYIEAI